MTTDSRTDDDAPPWAEELIEETIELRDAVEKLAAHVGEQREAES